MTRLFVLLLSLSVLHLSAALSLEEILKDKQASSSDRFSDNNNTTNRRPSRPSSNNRDNIQDKQAIQQAIDAAKSDIESLITQNKRLAPKFIRLGFHDCVGGCDGCVDLNESDNNGLDIPIDALEGIMVKQQQHKTLLSRADIWALAALTAAEMTNPQGQTFPLQTIGRVDCEDFSRMTRSRCHDKHMNIVACDAKHGPHRELPSPDLDTHGILSYFWKEFQFTPDQVVALMGAHSIGFADVHNSGFAGHDGWTPQSLALNNDFYLSLVAATWHQIPIDNSHLLNNIPDRFQWVRSNKRRRRTLRGGQQQQRNIQQQTNNTVLLLDGRGDDIFMLNADMALVRDFSQSFNQHTGEVTCDYTPQKVNSCPFAATFHVAKHYMQDEQAWMNDFFDVYNKMLIHGYVLEERSCKMPPCRLKKI